MIDPRLYAEVVALLGGATVRAALAAREAFLPLDVSECDQLAAAASLLAAAAPAERPGLVAALPEPLRRALALALLDRRYPIHLAHAAVAGAFQGPADAGGAPTIGAETKRSSDGLPPSPDQGAQSNDLCTPRKQRTSG